VASHCVEDLRDESPLSPQKKSKNENTKTKRKITDLGNFHYISNITNWTWICCALVHYLTISLEHVISFLSYIALIFLLLFCSRWSLVLYIYLSMLDALISDTKSSGFFFLPSSLVSLPKP